MRRKLFLALTMVLAAGAAAQASPIGLWRAKDGAQIRVSACGKQMLCGFIAATAQRALSVGLGLGRVLERMRRLLHRGPCRLSEARCARTVPASDRSLRSVLPEPVPDGGRAASA